MKKNIDPSHDETAAPHTKEADAELQIDRIIDESKESALIVTSIARVLEILSDPVEPEPRK